MHKEFQRAEKSVCRTCVSNSVKSWENKCDRPMVGIRRTRVPHEVLSASTPRTRGAKKTNLPEKNTRTYVPLAAVRFHFLFLFRSGVFLLGVCSLEGVPLEMLDNTFIEMIKASVDKPLPITVYNYKSMTTRCEKRADEAQRPPLGRGGGGAGGQALS